MLYSCTPVATVAVKGLMNNQSTHAYISFVPAYMKLVQSSTAEFSSDEG